MYDSMGRISHQVSISTGCQQGIFKRQKSYCSSSNGLFLSLRGTQRRNAEGFRSVVTWQPACFLFILYTTHHSPSTVRLIVSIPVRRLVRRLVNLFSLIATRICRFNFADREVCGTPKKSESNQIEYRWFKPIRFQ